MDTLNINPLGLDMIPDNKPVKVPDKLEEVKLNKLNVDNLVKAISFVGKIGGAIKSSLADDKKITLSDTPNFLSALVAAPGFITAIAEIPAEVTDDISAEEKAQIVEALTATGLIPDSAESAVDEGLKLVIDIKNYVFKYIVNA